jgi:hypothetical protein
MVASEGALGIMNLVLVRKNDIAVGQPSPWPLYDQEHGLAAEREPALMKKISSARTSQFLLASCAARR